MDRYRLKEGELITLIQNRMSRLTQPEDLGKLDTRGFYIRCRDSSSLHEWEELNTTELRDVTSWLEAALKTQKLSDVPFILDKIGIPESATGEQRMVPRIGLIVKDDSRYLLGFDSDGSRLRRNNRLSEGRRRKTGVRL